MTTITGSEPATAPPAAPEDHAPALAPRTGVWPWLRNGLPTAAVILALVGVAAWGHSTNWTLPKFSALVGTSAVEDDTWCKEHNVPESQCIECHPELLPKLHDFGWCAVHGVAQCPLEHSDLVQTKTTPIITPAMLERAQRALATRPREENGSRCALHLRRIQFASKEAVEKAGIDIAIVKEQPVAEALVANGEVVYDDTRLARLPSRVPGTVWRVEKKLGDAVRQGDVLALVDSADVGRAKADLLQALGQLNLAQVNLSRIQLLASQEIVEGRRLNEAEAAAREATIRLHSAQQALINLGLPVTLDEIANLSAEAAAAKLQRLGLPPDLGAKLNAATTSSNLFPLRAPLDGVMIERNVMDGEVVDTTRPLFTVGDVSQLWLTLNVRQEDARYVSLGQRVLFTPSDRRDEGAIEGAVRWISTAADEHTRTVKVRVDLPNTAGKMRANTFGTGRLVLREEPQAIVVPSVAIHWDGTCHVVFVRDKRYFEPDAPKFFHVRAVRLGATSGDNTEIIAGVLPGEVIASKNSVLLEAQLLKGNLGAGCCEADSK